MSVDTQSYTGEIEPPVAVEAQQDDTNSYQQETNEDVAVHKDLLEPSSKEESSAPEVNPQAEHFKALREEVNRLKTEQSRVQKEHEDQLQLLRNNQFQRAEKPQEQVRQPKMFDGMDESDVPNVREIRSAWEQRESEYQSRIEELQVQQMHPDYAEVIQKHLVPLIQSKPHLARSIQTAENKAMFAYELGLMAKQAQQQQAPVISEQPRVSETAQRIVENARKPGTLSQTGGQGALSKADYYASMSDKDFAKLATQHMEAV